MRNLLSIPYSPAHIILQQQLTVLLYYTIGERRLQEAHTGAPQEPPRSHSRDHHTKGSSVHHSREQAHWC